MTNHIASVFRPAHLVMMFLRRWGALVELDGCQVIGNLEEMLPQRKNSLFASKKVGTIFNNYMAELVC